MLGQLQSLRGEIPPVLTNDTSVVDAAETWMRAKPQVLQEACGQVDQNDVIPGLVQAGYFEPRDNWVCNSTGSALAAGMGNSSTGWLGRIWTLTLLASASLAKSFFPTRGFRPSFYANGTASADRQFRDGPAAGQVPLPVEKGLESSEQVGWDVA